MAITSLDIQNQSFAIDRKGYDVDEVDVFLEQVADEIDALNARIAELEAELAQGGAQEQQDDLAGFGVHGTIVTDDAADSYGEEQDETDALLAEKDALLAEKDQTIAELDDAIEDLKQQLVDAQANSNAVAAALIVAQRSADEVVQRANVRSDEIIAEANDTATRILDEAEADRQKIEDAIEALEVERANVRGDYQDMLCNFIDDASRKLAALDEDEKASANRAATGAAVAGAAGAAFVAAAAMSADDAEPLEATAAYQAPVREYDVFEDAAYNTTAMSQTVVAAATPTPAVTEKDFSGFGDTDDEFEFDEID